VLLVLAAIGLVAVFVIPLGAGHDEETHMERVWEMSAFYFLPNEGLGTPKLPYPMTFREISYRRQLLLRPIPPDFWSTNAGIPIGGADYFYGAVRTRSTYSPLLLLPQALAMRYFGRKFDMPFLDVYYAVRLAGLASYALLAWLAVRLMPFGKWTMAILAVSPTALFQASTVSVDAISQGIGLLYIAGCLAVASRDRIRPAGVVAILALSALLFAAKLNLACFAILPFLLLGPSRFSPRALYLGMAIAVVGLFFIEGLGWLWVGYRGNEAVGPAVDPLLQLAHILRSPSSLIRAVGSDMLRHGIDYVDRWVAAYGYDYWSVPAPVHILYLSGLVATAFFKDPLRSPSHRTRIALAAVGLIGCLATVTALYLFFSPVASAAVLGMHGRYFFPVAVPLWLALTGLSSAGERLRPLAAIAATASLVAFVLGAYLSYYVSCGTSYFRLGLCYQPVFKNWAPQENLSPPVEGRSTMVQEIIPECDGMTSLQLWIDPEAADPSGETSITLRDTQADINVIEARVPNRSLSRFGPLEWTFAPRWDSRDRYYQLRILQADDLIGPRFAYMLNSEYSPGNLLVDGTKVGEDLLFRYGCLSGLERLRRGTEVFLARPTSSPRR
jgi:uncharacterized membrane protein